MCGDGAWAKLEKWVLAGRLERKEGGGLNGGGVYRGERGGIERGERREREERRKGVGVVGGRGLGWCFGCFCFVVVGVVLCEIPGKGEGAGEGVLEIVRVVTCMPMVFFGWCV